MDRLAITKTILALCLAGGATTPVSAKDATIPPVVYDDGLRDGWQNWSWAKVRLEVPSDKGKPIEAQGDAWSAVMLHHAPFSTAGFSKLTFAISGGAEGGQALYVKAMANGKPLAGAFEVRPTADTWTTVEVKLADIGAADTTIDAIALQGAGAPFKPFYVNRIAFR